MFIVKIWFSYDFNICIDGKEIINTRIIILFLGERVLGSPGVRVRRVHRNGRHIIHIKYIQPSRYICGQVSFIVIIILYLEYKHI